ncbi:MAG TPA: carboxylating nicotinate-nucleotide diphosphorylase [Longimicrobiales bacterium]
MTDSDRGTEGALPPPGLPIALVRPIVERALAEDLAWGDTTTALLVPAELVAEGRVIARAAGIVAGLPVAELAFRLVEPDIQVRLLARDGDTVQPGQELAAITGPARGILTAERVALNFLQRLSGIATLTARFVAAVQGTGARIVDTRKTTPGLRLLEKYAVRCGGGANHRFDLSGAVMVKDNHRAALRAAGISLPDAVRRARAALSPMVPIEIEVDRLEELDEALAAAPDAILLDNMTPAELAEAVRRIQGRAHVEASGGINLENVRQIAETGVDVISVGALTHSAPALDVSLEFIVKGS